MKRGDRGAGTQVEGTARADLGLQQNQGTGLRADGSGTHVRNRTSMHSERLVRARKERQRQKRSDQKESPMCVLFRTTQVGCTGTNFD